MEEFFRYVLNVDVRSIPSDGGKLGSFLGGGGERKEEGCGKKSEIIKVISASE